MSSLSAVGENALVPLLYLASGCVALKPSKTTDSLFHSSLPPSSFQLVFSFSLCPHKS